MRWVIYFKLGGYNATNKNYNIYLVTVVEVGSLWSQICHETEDDLELRSFCIFLLGEGGGGIVKGVPPIQLCIYMHRAVLRLVLPESHSIQIIFHSSDFNWHEVYSKIIVMIRL